MGNICEPSKPVNKKSYISCTYDIKDFNETHIINDRGEKYINEEIGAKIKIMNGNRIENLTFKKRFNKLGINIIKFIIQEKLNDMSYLFNKCSSLKSVNFYNVETIQVNRMVAMFQFCKELEFLDLTEFKTSNVNDLSNIFYECNKLKTIKGINKFNTANATLMYGMFSGCSELENLDLCNFNTSNVTDMAHLFDGCKKLKQIKGINNFNTIYTTTMEAMFQECNELQNLDLSKFNTGQVKDMGWIFMDVIN